MESDDIQSETIIREYVNSKLTDDRTFNGEDESILYIHGERFTASDIDEALTDLLE